MFSCILLLYMPRVFAMHFPKFMEARSMLQSQEAANLVFPPLGIHLREAKGGKWINNSIICCLSDFQVLQRKEETEKRES